MDERDPLKRKQPPDMNQPMASPGASPAKEPETAMEAILEPDLQAHIGRQLRAVYDEVVNEAVPDKFLKLLEELERKQSERS